VHRIGRTGRAGRKGEAILFVTPREKGMLRAIERATRQPIEEMQLPSVEAVNDKRVQKFLSRIGTALETGGVEEFRPLIENYEREHNVPAIEIAAALAKLVQGDTPLLLQPERQRAARPHADYERGEKTSARPERRREAPESKGPSTSLRYAQDERKFEKKFERGPRVVRSRDFDNAFDESGPFESNLVEKPRREKKPRSEPEVGMETFRIEVGHEHGVKPANIVGAIANEAGLESRYIGRIDIHDDYSVIDLPEGMPRETLMHLKKVWVSGQQLRIRKVGEDAHEGGDAPPRKHPNKSFKPKDARGGFKPAGAKKPHRKGPGKPRD
jgi:ATP-dependent RNA helicase DeaD